MFDHRSHTIEDENDYMQAIYPLYNSQRRFATAGVFFNLYPREIEYHIWSNATYSQQVYGTASINRNPHFMTIQNAIEHAIYAQSTPDLKPVSISIRNNPWVNVLALGEYVVGYRCNRNVLEKICCITTK